MDEVLVHLHVPKCAGTSIRNALLRTFGDERTVRGHEREIVERLAVMSPAERSEVRVVSGHVTVKILRFFANRPAICVAAVRDPIERICSFFNFVHTQRRHPMHSIFEAQLPSPDALTDEIMESRPFFTTAWSNPFCRILAGVPTTTDADYGRVERDVRQRVRAGELHVGNVAEVEAYLRRGGFVAETLPRANVFVGGDGHEPFQTATPSRLSAATLRRLRDWNRYDLQLFRAMGWPLSRPIELT
ncbi:sulfotransferase family 2 domain-containing protein [Acuticoccus mangrovi]|uniref:Sulfotransferase family 2 domain-containing protein n=1 Tax=Acuticoccus mangrovi TaxID=2796142 RepID=A0A934MGZ0_9HYPH|nr:sulfotransferase family 2 domain-containing protein [Acuticoccus mangrovi]MBJ3775511.1 sulfotransferase family 2 domain-containing protein [Acuticoccus mangrovi]